MARTLAFVVAALLVLAPAASRADATSVPSISLKAIDGATVRLAQLKGRILLIDFWATWCAGCKTSFPALEALAASMRDRGVDVLAVSVDERRKDLDAFLKERPAAAVRVLLDPRMSAADAFAVAALPTAFIVDRQGQIRYTHKGYAPEAVDQFAAEIRTLLDESRQ